MTIVKLFPSGAYLIYAIRHGTLVSERYYDYTRREAVALFRAEHPAR